MPIENVTSINRSAISIPSTHSIEPSVKRRILYVDIALVLLQHLAILCIGAGVQIDHQQRLSWHTLLIKNLSQWDGQWFIQIAKYGYYNLAHMAFFPMYPVSIRLLHDITGMGFAASGVVVSAVSFSIALYFLALLVGRQFGYLPAILTMALVTTFPTSFYYGAVYSESMFLAFSVLAIYFSYRHRFLYACIYATLATLTRNTGGLLEIILLLDYLSMQEMGIKFWTLNWWKRLDWRVTALFLPPTSLGCYLVWLRFHTGYFLPFLHAEAIWHRIHRPIWQVLFGSFRQLFNSGQWAPRLVAYHSLEVATWCMMVASLYVGVKVCWRSFQQGRRTHTQIGYLLYVAITIWICSTEPAHQPGHHWDYLLSFPRLALMLFPAFMYVSVALRSSWSIATALTVASATFIVNYTMFCSGSFIA